MDDLSASEESPSETVRAPIGLLALLHVIAFFSGTAALIYELVWTRRLIFVFGATIRAVSAVLAAYMGGLALGSLLMGPRAERAKRPLMLYAVVEGGIAVGGAMVPWVLRKMQLLDSRLYDETAALGGLTLFRFVLAFVVVGVPAALMGATFPLLTQVAVRAGGERKTMVPSLYAANTFGAVAGTFLSGFFLLGSLGLRGTEFVAVAVNLSIAITSALLFRSAANAASAPVTAAPVAETPVESEVSTTHKPWVYGSVMLVGFVSLASEVLWSRALCVTFSGISTTTYAFTAMLGVFLAAMALGSSLYALFEARVAQPMRAYALLVTIAGVAVVVSALSMINHGSAPFGHAIDTAGNLKLARALLNLVFESIAVVGLPAMLFGAAFPAAIRVLDHFEATEQKGPHLAKLYATSTAGGIAGSLLAAYAVVPLAGVTRGVLALGALLCGIGLLLLALAPRRGESWGRFAIVAGAVVAVVSMVVVKLPRHPQLTTDSAPVVFYEEGPTATVAVLQTHDGYRRIDVDGMPVAGTSPTMLTDQKSLAHFPMALVAHPQRALTVGFGSGGTSHSLLLHRQLAQVHVVEIAPEMLHGAPYLTASNHGVVTRGEPRYRVVLDDARSYLAHTQTTYDIIATDCTDLRYRSNANLYDVEYFQHCRARLNPGGVVAVWLPLGGLSVPMFRIALRTFGEVFSDYVVFWPNGFPSHYVILVGWRDARLLRWDLFQERLSTAAIASDMNEISLRDPARVLSTLVSDGASLRASLRDTPTNTEDHPILEFQAPLYGYSPHAALDNLHFLLDHHAPVQSLLSQPMPAPDAARLQSMERALPRLALAHAASFENDRVLAARLYLETLAIAPNDSAMQARVSESRADLLTHPEDPWTAVLLCRTEQLLQRADRARLCFGALRPALLDDDQRAAATLWTAELEPAR